MKNKILNITNWIETHQEELFELLKDLIKIESVNPWFSTYKDEPKEQEIQLYIQAYLEKLGFETDVWEPDSAKLIQYKGKPGYYAGRDFKKRPNLYANYKGKGDGKSILLTGHIDVVSAGENWTKKPFDPVIENGKLYGRGALDMKGGVAAMLFAAKAIIESGTTLNGDIRIGTVCDEEAGGMGSLSFIDRGYRADASIMTEATDMKIAPLCRGILWGKLTIFGRSGHIEIKQGDWRNGGAVDAIALAHIFMNAIQAKNQEWAKMDRKNHPLIPLPCQINISQINAGEYPTTFAGKCELVFDIQYLPSERDENLLGGHIKKEIEEFIASVATTNDWMRENPPLVEWLIDADCAETPIDNNFVKSFIEASKMIDMDLGVEGSHFHTDMGWFCNVGIPTINFGAGNPKFAHQADESVPLDDLVDSAKTIAASIIHWCDNEEGNE